MDKIVERLAFNFLIAQVLPAAILIVLGAFLVHFNAGGSAQAAFTATLTWLGKDGTVLAVVIAAMPLGLLLWAISTTTTANRESFRTRYLNAEKLWVYKAPEDCRPRTWLRKYLSRLWTNGAIFGILLLSPLILSFDLASTLTSRPRDLYKFINVLRAPKIENEIYLTVINDFQFSSSYFGCMAVALLLATGWAGVILVERRDLASIALLASLYLLCGVHYLLGRLLQIAFDHSVDPSKGK